VDHPKHDGEPRDDQQQGGRQTQDPKTGGLH
jgi:hypothetical protein